MTHPRLLGDRYELEEVIGQGGMSEVYRARDIRLDRVVAIKTLRADLARDQTFQTRFRREAQSSASLNSPSIVAVYDTSEDMVTGVPVPYIVLELVDGRTLMDLLIEGHRLLPERALDIISGVLRALEYSHRAGVVHRDIEPGNVMVTRDWDVKVMGFGVARAQADYTSTGAQITGTARYMSPEQARGERADARSDLYSTGCLMYELLTGRPPFTGDSATAVAYQQVWADPVPPSRLDPELPQWADAIVLKAMAKKPDGRYQTAAEMQADIQGAASGVPVEEEAVVSAATRADYNTPRSQRIGRSASPSWEVFLSYRRDDAGPYARLLQFHLRERIPDARVFMDLDSIEAGLDFAEVITEAVGTCVVLVVLIGRQWLKLTDDDGRRRIDNLNDYVRFEVQAALERGVRVIPVLIDGAKAPRRQQLPPGLQQLARLNHVELSYKRYEYDADRLVDLIERVLRGRRSDARGTPGMASKEP